MMMSDCPRYLSIRVLFHGVCLMRCFLVCAKQGLVLRVSMYRFCVSGLLSGAVR